MVWVSGCGISSPDESTFSKNGLFTVGTELSLYGLSPHARAAPELYSFGNKAIRMLSVCFCVLSLLL